jgi:hypothetical protein
VRPIGETAVPRGEDGWLNVNRKRRRPRRSSGIAGEDAVEGELESEEGEEDEGGEVTDDIVGVTEGGGRAIESGSVDKLGSER